MDVSMLFERLQYILFDSVFQINFVSVAKACQFGNLAQVDFGFRPASLRWPPCGLFAISDLLPPTRV